jgi:hypothetical protein
MQWSRCESPSRTITSQSFIVAVLCGPLRSPCARRISAARSLAGTWQAKQGHVGAGKSLTSARRPVRPCSSPTCPEAGDPIGSAVNGALQSRTTKPVSFERDTERRSFHAPQGSRERANPDYCCTLTWKPAALRALMSSAPSKLPVTVNVPFLGLAVSPVTPSTLLIAFTMALLQERQQL